MLHPPPGPDGAEKGASHSAEPNRASLGQQKETGIQMGHERPRWVCFVLQIYDLVAETSYFPDCFCFALRTVFLHRVLEFSIVCRFAVSSSRLDWLLHHLWHMHEQDGREREGHVWILQHPQRDYHDDGFLNHVVSGMLLFTCLCGFVCLQACMWVNGCVGMTFWRYHTHTHRGRWQWWIRRRLCT